MTTAGDLDLLADIFEMPCHVAVGKCVGLARDFFGLRGVREQLSALDRGSVMPRKIERRKDHFELTTILPSDASELLIAELAKLPPLRVSGPIFDHGRLANFMYADLPLEFTLSPIGISTDGKSTAWAYKNRPTDAPLELIFVDASTSAHWPVSFSARPGVIKLTYRLSVAIIDGAVHQLIDRPRCRRTAKRGFAGILTVIDDVRTLQPVDVSALLIFREGDSDEPWLSFHNDDISDWPQGPIGERDSGTVTDPQCVRCRRPVVRNRNQFDTFEHMHWSCFHYEVEHSGDPDIACADPSCPARAFDPEPPPIWPPEI